MKIRDDNYFQVSGWMITKLGLNGNRLLVYAIIYGFSQDGESEFNGGMDYLVQLTGASRRTVINTLNELTEAGLLIKRSTMKKGVEYSSYICTSEKIAPVQEMHQCENCTTTSANSALPTSAKIAPNNKSNNKKINNNPPISSLAEKPEPKFLPIVSLMEAGVDESLAKDFLSTRKTKFTESALKDLLSECKKAGLSPQEALTTVVGNGWQGFKAEWVRNNRRESLNDKRQKIADELCGRRPVEIDGELNWIEH